MSRNESAVHQIHTNPVAAAGKRGKGSAGKRADIKAKIADLRTEAKETRAEAKEARVKRKYVLDNVKDARATLRGRETELRKADAVVGRLAKRNDSLKTKISRLTA